MCLSNAYEVGEGTEKLLAERVANVVVDGGNVKLTDLFGGQIVVPGVIKSIDLNKNVILIQPQ